MYAVGSADAREPGADDQNVEVLGDLRHHLTTIGAIRTRSGRRNDGAFPRLRRGRALGGLVRWGPSPPRTPPPPVRCAYQWSPSAALDRRLVKKPRSTVTPFPTAITIVAINSGSQIGRWWSACQMITRNRVVTNSRMSRQCSVKYLAFL